MGKFTHLYKTGSWRALRASQLRDQPFCAMHMETGQMVPADTVDHKVPHKGDMRLFTDKQNLQSLCASCHSQHKQRQERRGFLTGADEHGNPLDPNHHWNHVKTEESSCVKEESVRWGGGD